MQFDGFISYSHAADGRLAPAVQRGLHRLAKPWHRRRALWIFRDQTGLAVTPKLWTSIQEAMDGSKHFVLLASPEAAGSPWVNREIEHWLATKSPDRILPVVTDGEWQWDPDARDFTPDSTSVPDALRGVFAEEPLYLDLRWARDDLHLSLQHIRFRDSIAQLAAPMHGVSKDELEGEDVRQHRRARRLSAVAAAMLVILTVVASVTGAVAVRNAERAEVAASEAQLQQRLASEQRDTAERATAESHRQQRNAREQEARAQVATAETGRQERLAREKQALAEDATAEAARQQGLARSAADEAELQQALAEEASAEAKREQDDAARYRDDAEAAKKNARRYRDAAAAASAEASAAEAEAVKALAEATAAVAEAVKAQEEAEKASAEAERQKAEAERQKAAAEQQKAEAERQKAAAEQQKAEADRQAANARRQEELANQATARAREQERIAEQHRELARQAEAERKRQEELARKAAEEAERQRQAAELQQRVAVNLRLMDRARAMIGGDPRKALMLGVAAQSVHDDPQTREQLSHLAMSTSYAGSLADVDEVAALAGQALATTGDGGTVSLWDTSDPADPVRLAQLPPGEPASLTASRDGKTLAVYDGSPVAALWNVTDPAHPVRTATLTAPAGITSVTFSPDGRTVATGTTARDTVLWDVAGAEPAVLSTVPKAYPLLFGPDGKTALASGDAVTVWDLTDRSAPVQRSTVDVGWGDKVVDAEIAFHPELPIVAAMGPSGYLYLWDLTDPADPQQGASMRVAKGGTSLSTLAFSPDGDMLAWGDSDGLTSIWSFDYHNEWPTFLAQIASLATRGGPVRAMAFSPDSRTLTTAGDRRTATLWYSRGRYTRSPIATMPGPFPGRVLGLAFAPDNSWLIAGGKAGTGVLWDLADPANPVRRDGLKLHTGIIDGMGLSDDGRTLVVLGADRTVTLLDMARPAEPVPLSTFTDPGEPVWAMALSADARTLAIGHSTGKTSLWDLTDRSKPVKLTELGLRDMMSSIAFSPDGRTMAVGEGSNVSLWDVTDRAAPVRYTSIPMSDYSNYHANSLEFTADGRTLAAATTDNGTIKIWDVSDPYQARQIANLTGHSGYALWASFSPDGRTLTTAGLDNAMILWDVADMSTPIRYGMIKSPDMQSFSTDLSPDGRTLAAGGTYGLPTKNVTLWDITVPPDLAADPAGNACAVSGRGLTAEEWARYVPELPYRATC
ncbi:TIR domain-containing protein [Actinoplanes sp. NPDC023714]|uniref:TIR domain-containing protein n=1 Tax=Actinoplanes sp. NPDC023714 TaxID=3154322 RepID=UPI0033C1DFFF